MDKLEQIRQLALANQATLISDTVKQYNEYYEFEDLEGKRFEINSDFMRRKGWPKDLNSYLKRSEKMQKSGDELFDEMRHVAQANNGKLLSPKWMGVNFRYQFETHDGNKFTRRYDNFKKLGWPKYQINNIPNTEKYQQLKEIIQSRNGILLTKKWLGEKVKHEIKDEYGNIFYLTPRQIKQGGWTPDRGLVSEPICRQALEHLFGYKFPKTRKILIPKVTGRKKSLELDGYSKELNVAFEYQGHDAHWDINHKKYRDISENDTIKKQVCKKLNIMLIIIPPFKEKSNKWNEKNVLEHILKEIKCAFENTGRHYELTIEGFKINFSIINHAQEMLKELLEIVQKNNGKLIKKEWRGSAFKHEFQTESGEIFKASFQNLKSNGWPLNLSQYNNHSAGHMKNPSQLLDEMNKIAQKNQGKLLSKEWMGTNFKYTFESLEGIIFKKSHMALKDTGWPKDISEYNKKMIYNYLEYLENIASKNGGKLLSKEWLGTNKKYEFEYSDGTKFSIGYNHLKNSGWPKKIQTFLNMSKESFHQPEYYLNKMHEIAQQNNCSLLSTEWKGNKYRYLFEDSSGKQFTATYIYLKVKKFKNFEV